MKECYLPYRCFSPPRPAAASPPSTISNTIENTAGDLLMKTWNIYENKKEKQHMSWISFLHYSNFDMAVTEVVAKYILMLNYLQVIYWTLLCIKGRWVPASRTAADYNPLRINALSSMATTPSNATTPSIAQYASWEGADTNKKKSNFACQTLHVKLSQAEPATNLKRWLRN